jgi:hypothetical protein
MKIWPLAALLSACSFNAPAAPGAFNACEAWFAACREKAVECGDDPKASQAIYERSLDDVCSKVVWSDTDEIYGKCIPTVLNATCDDSRHVSCGGYAHL